MFTRREKEIVDLVLVGCSTKQIANMLYITPKTVGFHLTNIYRKENVCSKVELVIKILKKDKLSSISIRTVFGEQVNLSSLRK